MHAFKKRRILQYKILFYKNLDKPLKWTSIDYDYVKKDKIHPLLHVSYGFHCISYSLNILHYGKAWFGTVIIIYSFIHSLWSWGLNLSTAHAWQISTVNYTPRTLHNNLKNWQYCCLLVYHFNLLHSVDDKLPAEISKLQYIRKMYRVSKVQIVRYEKKVMIFRYD